VIDAPLTATEARVLGCLVEKSMTTPDGNPLTLNSLVTACNQRTNRDPVMDLTDAEVIDAVNGLRERDLCRLSHAPGGRAVRYQHTMAERLAVEPPAAALLAVLLLRGAQTPGELRARTGRYHEFTGVAEVDALLGDLAGRGLVERLTRRPGEKEHRWRHLLSADGTDEETMVETPAIESRLAALEDRVDRLETQLERLTGH
jgi:uncharacterized protein YceH (UPF0502 family)